MVEFWLSLAEYFSSWTGKTPRRPVSLIRSFKYIRNCWPFNPVWPSKYLKEANLHVPNSLRVRARAKRALKVAFYWRINEKQEHKHYGRVRLGSIRNKNNWNNASKHLFGSYSHSGIPGFSFWLFCSHSGYSFWLFILAIHSGYSAPRSRIAGRARIMTSCFRCKQRWRPVQVKVLGLSREGRASGGAERTLCC